MKKQQVIAVLFILGLLTGLSLWYFTLPKPNVVATMVLVNYGEAYRDILAYRVFADPVPILVEDAGVGKSADIQVFAINFPKEHTTSEILGWMRIRKFRPANARETFALAKKRLPNKDPFASRYVSLVHVKELGYGTLNSGFLNLSCEKPDCLGTTERLFPGGTYYRVRVVSSANIPWNTDHYFTAVRE